MYYSHLKGELFAVTDQLWQTQESLEQAQQDIATLNGLIAHLQASEETLNENVRSLTDKYQYLETNMGKQAGRYSVTCPSWATIFDGLTFKQ